MAQQFPPKKTKIPLRNTKITLKIFFVFFRLVFVFLGGKNRWGIWDFLGELLFFRGFLYFFGGKVFLRDDFNVIQLKIHFEISVI